MTVAAVAKHLQPGASPCGRRKFRVVDPCPRLELYRGHYIFGSIYRSASRKYSSTHDNTTALATSAAALCEPAWPGLSRRDWPSFRTPASVEQHVHAGVHSRRGDAHPRRIAGHPVETTTRFRRRHSLVRSASRADHPA